MVISMFPTKQEVKSSAGNEGGSGDIWVLKKRIEEVLNSSCGKGER